MKVLVTGGAGFIGRWLVKTLLDSGIDVVVVDNLSSGSLENISEFTKKKGFIDFYEESINEERLLKKITKIKFDIIFHLAASINVQESIEDPKKTFEEDVVATVKLLENSRSLQAKFIFVSTCLVYDAMKGKTMDETHPTLPSSPYA